MDSSNYGGGVIDGLRSDLAITPILHSATGQETHESIVMRVARGNWLAKPKVGERRMVVPGGNAPQSSAYQVLAHGHQALLLSYWTRTFSVARKYFANRPIWVFLSSPWTKRRPPGDSPTNQRVTFGLRCSLLSPPRVERYGRTHWINGIDSVHCLRAIHSGQ